MTQEEIDFFDRMAPQWDANEVCSTSERVASILDKIGVASASSVLDLGTGTGVLLPRLSQLVGPRGHVAAVDLSEGMLSEARRKYGDLSNVEFLKIDFEEEPLPGKYDLAMLYCVYPHLHRPADTFEWLFKMNLNVGGRIVVAFPSDEKFINNIHHEKKADHDHLPPARMLAETIATWGYDTKVLAESADEYIVEVKQSAER